MRAEEEGARWDKDRKKPHARLHQLAHLSAIVAEYTFEENG